MFWFVDGVNEGRRAARFIKKVNFTFFNYAIVGYGLSEPAARPTTLLLSLIKQKTIGVAGLLFGLPAIQSAKPRTT